MKEFNTTGVCVPEKHYMVDITGRLIKIESMIEKGQYFTINRGRQYGKTTTLNALKNRLRDKYLFIDLDFQDIGNEGFADEDRFSRSFAMILYDSFEQDDTDESKALSPLLESINVTAEAPGNPLSLLWLFRELRKICAIADKPVVLMIDEVDSATDDQVFLDFLAQLRSLYLKRERGRDVHIFKSVILAGVTDIKNMKRKIRPDETHKVNSPWNIASDFDLNMSLPINGIEGMLAEYEADHGTGMDVSTVAQEIYAYTSGYPFLVSRICQIISTRLVGDRFKDLSDAWTGSGISEAVRILLMERNTLFDSLMGKVLTNNGLSELLEKLLFTGEDVPYNPDSPAIADSVMYGFVYNDHGKTAISNRIFETRLYNYYIGEAELKNSPVRRADTDLRSVLVKNGKLLFKMLLEKYIHCFDEIYEEQYESFDEAEGLRRFLLFIRPIINGTGNYYIEARTRNSRRMDIVIDYLGERHIVELKIWRGKAYHEKGEKQLADYLEYYHIKKGYMLTYSFNQKKKRGITTVKIGDKELTEALV